MDLRQKTSTFAVNTKEGEAIDACTIKTTPEAIRKYFAPYAGSSLVLEPVSQW